MPQRALFLARGDLVGKALAHPDSLTLAERYEVMGREPPDKLHQAIRDATGGEASTPRDLVDMVQQSSFSVEALTLEALELLLAQFMAFGELFRDNDRFPGKWEARRLLGAREGVDDETVKRVCQKALARCEADPVIRAARQAKFESAEACGEKGLLVQLPEPYVVLSLEESFQRWRSSCRRRLSRRRGRRGTVATHLAISWTLFRGEGKAGSPEMGEKTLL
ncbi:hypothetical protein PG985_016298 [Apiospora marii]|uniref:uncharacterized protein n=1 Tax=Apiospora marii TaxID=335849 RepID=UPI0031313F84